MKMQGNNIALQARLEIALAKNEQIKHTKLMINRYKLKYLQEANNNQSVNTINYDSRIQNPVSVSTTNREISHTDTPNQSFQSRLPVLTKGRAEEEKRYLSKILASPSKITKDRAVGDSDGKMAQEKMVEETLKSTNSIKNEKIDFKIIKNVVKREAIKQRNPPNMLSNLNNVDIKNVQLTPYQKFRGIAKGVFHLIVLYYSAQRYKFQLKNNKMKEINKVYQHNEEVIKTWLLKWTNKVLRSIIHDAEEIDYDFTTIIAFFGHKKIKDK